MTFILNMAWREMRASWHRLLLFFLCIAIGVGSIVGVRSFTELLAASLVHQARALFAADVRVTTGVPWRPDTRAMLDRYISSPLVTGYTEITEMQTMVRAEREEARPAMVELRAVKPYYPLHGTVRTIGDASYSHAMLADRGAVVSPNLLNRLGLQVGDRIRVGASTFTIRGAADRMPGSALNFGAIPRVLIDHAALADAGLVGFGSRVRFVSMYRTREGEDGALAQALGAEARQARMPVSIDTYRFVETWLSRSYANIDGFTGLVGLSILVLGGIGVASVTRVFIQQRLRTIAILKCLGGRNRRVLGAYFMQSLALSVAGSLFGVALAYAITVIGVQRLDALVPLDLQTGITLRASLLGVGTGVLIALLFSLPPLLDIRHIKPALVLRHDTGARSFDWLQLAARLVLVLALVAIAVWQAGTYRRVGVFIGGIMATALVLNLAGIAVMAALRKLGHLPSFVLRHGVGSLHRPGNQTKVVLFAVGIGSLFLIAVRMSQVTLLSEFRLDHTLLDVDMFMMDIQKDQRADAEATFASLGATGVRMVPIVRARLSGIRWTDPARALPEGPGRRFGNEYRVSYRADREASETIVAGTFWDGTPSAEPEISIDDDMAGFWQLEVGDTMTFTVLGRRLDARVTSIRQSDTNVRSLTALTRFGVIFRPGVLEETPHTFVGALKGPAGPARARLQNAFLDRFPNVTLLDALDEIQELRTRIDSVAAGISVLGAFVYGCGVLILIGSIAMTRLQRIYEAAILKALGARKSVIIKIATIEYSVLGLLAGLIGSSAAIGVTYAMTTIGRMRAPWQLQPAVNIAGALATVALVTLVGILASWGVITKKPLGILREQ